MGEIVQLTKIDKLIRIKKQPSISSIPNNVDI